MSFIKQNTKNNLKSSLTFIFITMAHIAQNNSKKPTKKLSNHEF